MCCSLWLVSPPGQDRDGATFSLPPACEVQFDTLSVVLEGKCKLLSRVPYNILLKMNFLARVPLVLDMKNLVLSNPFSSPVLGYSLSATPQPIFYRSALSVRRLASPGFVESKEPKIVSNMSEPVKPSTDVKGEESNQDMLSANYGTIDY